MTSNPIKVLSDLFSKFIIEHGSAVIQEKHIALLKEQFSLLQKKNIILETENKALKNKDVNLKNKIKIYEQFHNNPPDEYKMKWGCLTFPDDERLYCPKCYFDKSRKIPTTRKNTKLRFCSICQKDIPSG